MNGTKNVADPNPGVSLVRRKYLDVLRQIVVAMVQRRTLEMYQLCEENVREREPDALEKYALLRARIAALAEDMRKVEERGQDMVGVRALLGCEPEPVIRLVVALLVGKALSSSVADKFDGPTDLAELATGTASPKDLLTVREAFANPGGVLRLHCHIYLFRTVDQSKRVSLTERALRTVLGLDQAPAAEFEILAARDGWRHE